MTKTIVGRYNQYSTLNNNHARANELYVLNSSQRNESNTHYSNLKFFPRIAVSMILLHLLRHIYHHPIWRRSHTCVSLRSFKIDRTVPMLVTRLIALVTFVLRLVHHCSLLLILLVALRIWILIPFWYSLLISRGGRLMFSNNSISMPSLFLSESLGSLLLS